MLFVLPEVLTPVLQPSFDLLSRAFPFFVFWPMPFQTPVSYSNYLTYTSVFFVTHEMMHPLAVITALSFSLSFFNNFIYLLLAVPGLHPGTGFPPVVGCGGRPPAAGLGF